MLVLAQAADDEWQNLVGDWLVRSGCRYMVAWGVGCGSWEDSVDWASIVGVGLGDVPDDRFVMTTSHDSEPLSEAFWFAANCAYHPALTLDETLIIDVSEYDRRAEILKAYSEAQTEIP